MTALDVTPWITAEDTPELSAFKAKVAQAAKDHSAQFHCGEYASFLRTVGINDPTKIAVAITTTLGMQFTVKAKPADLHGKTEDEQKVFLCDKIGEIKLQSGAVAGSMRVLPTMVSEMSLVTEPPSAEEAEGESKDDADSQYVWRYTSQDGRVRHAFTPTEIQSVTGYGYAYAACGKTAYRDITEHSRRGENRNCSDCERRAV